MSFIILSGLHYFVYCSNFGGLCDTAKKIGLSEHLKIKLSMLDEADAARGTQCFAVNTDYKQSTKC